MSYPDPYSSSPSSASREGAASAPYGQHTQSGQYNQSGQPGQSNQYGQHSQYNQPGQYNEYNQAPQYTPAGGPFGPQPCSQEKSGNKALWWVLGCCGALVLASIAAFVGLILLGMAAGSDSPSSSSSSSAATESSSEATEHPTSSESTGSAASPAANATIQVIKAHPRTKTLAQDGLSTTAENQFLPVEIEFTNTGSKQMPLMSTEFELIGPDGTTYSPTNRLIYTDNSLIYEEVSPGASFKGVVVFDVPDSAQFKTLKYTSLTEDNLVIEVPVSE